MLLTDEERTEWGRMNKAFTDRHPGCRSLRWSMSGSRTTHCGECCPPPPLGYRQIEPIARLLQSVAATDPSDLDTWRLTLTCTHTVDRTQHRTNHSWTSSTVHCPDCSHARGVVASEKLPHSPSEMLPNVPDSTVRSSKRLKNSNEGGRRWQPFSVTSGNSRLNDDATGQVETTPNRAVPLGAQARTPTDKIAAIAGKTVGAKQCAPRGAPGGTRTPNPFLRTELLFH
jgi:hypothetical protein